MGVKLQPSLPATAAAVYAFVYRAAASNATVNQFSPILYDTVIAQSAGNPYDAVGTHQFVASRAGTLRVTATQQIANIAYTELVLALFKGGAELTRGPQIALTIKAIWLAVTVPCAVNDAFDIRVFQSSVGDQALGQGQSGAHCEFVLN